MKLFRILGFVSTVLGIGGMAGAIEFGTGYLLATVLGIGGTLLMTISKERQDEKDNTDIIDMLVACTGNDCKRRRM